MLGSTAFVPGTREGAVALGLGPDMRPTRAQARHMPIPIRIHNAAYVALAPRTPDPRRQRVIRSTLESMST